MNQTTYNVLRTATMFSLLLTSEVALGQALRGQRERNAAPSAQAAPAPPQGTQSPATDGEPIVIGRTFSIDSEVLAQKRNITVGLPRGYDDTDQRYPVLYVLDGESNFLTAQGAAQFHAKYGNIPPLIVVALHNGGRRTSEMTPDDMIMQGWEGTGDQFLDFFERELIPFIDATYRTQPFRILHGHSHGAIIGTYSFTSRPELFKWHLMMDMPPQRGDSFLEKGVFAHLTSTPDRVGRLVSVQRKFGWFDEDWKHLVEMAPESLYLDRITIPRRESHETMLWEGTYLGLKSLFFDFALKETRTKTLADLKQQYGTMSRDYGYAIEIPERLLEDNILDLVIQQRGPEAKQLFDHMVRVHHSRGQFRDWGEIIPTVIERGPPEESVADMLAWAPPNAAQMTPFLGEWEGLVEASFPFGLRVKIAAHEGRVVVETTMQRPDGPWGDLQTHEALRLLDDGTLEWGLYNNMRPFILVVYSLRLEGGELIGRQTMRGGSMGNIMPNQPVPQMPNSTIRMTQTPREME